MADSGDEVHAWSALRVLEAFRRKEIAPSEYLGVLAARIEQWQPVVNCLGDVYLDEALEVARRSDDAYAHGTARPLEGLPVVVKDETEYAGHRTTNGSLLWTDWVPEQSDPLVERLLDAGAVIHARGLTPEFSSAFWCHSRLWGVTRNPWNPAYDVSGSSGGSAAALAAGLTPLATGSDIGGSIRTPASVCGVVGVKPPSGRIPMAGLYGRVDWCSVGPLARTAADCALVVDAVSGHHPGDHFSLREPTRIGVPSSSAEGLRVAFSPDLGDWPVTSSVRALARAAADALADAGAVVEDVDLVVTREEVRRAGDAHHRALMVADLVEAVGDRRADCCGYSLHWIDTVNDPPDPATFLEGRRIEVAVSARIDRVLADHDVLLTPAMCLPAFPAGYDEQTYTLDGVERDVLHDLHLTEVFNVANRCPVVTVPVGRSSGGVPVGLQVVGRTYDDATALRVAAALQAAVPQPAVAPFPG